MSVKLPIVSYAVLAALTVSAAYADTNAADTQGIETVVVTAQKRAQNPIEVPFALTAYSSAFMKDIGIKEFDKLSLYVPGFEVQNQSPNNPGFVMRGITSDSGDPTQEPRVAVFEDDVSITATRGSYVELFDIDRVEVSKGPQSTLFGRAALIGGVNIIQNKANFDGFSASFDSEFGDYDYRMVDGAVNIPLTDDLAVRVAGRYKSRNGYVDNLNGGENYNSVNTGAARIALAWRPTETFNADIIANFEEDSPSGTSFKSGTFAPTNPATGAVIGDLSHTSGASLTDHLDGFEDNKRLGLQRTVWDVKALTTTKLSPALTLTTTSAYRRLDSEEVFDPDGSALTIAQAAEDERSDQFSHEMRLNFDDGGRFSGFGGIGYFYNNTSQRVPMQFDENDVLGLYLGGNYPTYYGSLFTDMQTKTQSAVDSEIKSIAASYLTSALYPSYYAAYYSALVGAYGSAVAGNLAKTYATAAASAYGSGLAGQLKSDHWEQYTSYGKTKSVDLYLDGTYRITDALELEAGVRYTNDDKTSSYAAQIGDRSMLGIVLHSSLSTILASSTERTKILTSTAVDAANPDPLLDYGIEVQPTANNGDKISRKFSDDGFAWRMSLRYAVDDNASVYFNYARGRRPKVLSADSPTTPYGAPTFTPIPAETVDSFEAGYKTLAFNGALRFDAALYYYDYSHFQSSCLSSDGKTCEANTGTVGTIIDFDAGKAESYGLETSADWTIAPWANLFVTYTYNRARFVGSDSLYQGNQMRLNPDHKLSVGASLHEHFLAGTFNFLPTYTWQSKIYFDDDNDIESEQSNLFPDTKRDEFQKQYGLVELHLNYQPDGQSWSIGFFVSNLLDQKYIKDAGNSGDGLGIPTFIAGEPRFFGGSISYKFQ